MCPLALMLDFLHRPPMLYRYDVTSIPAQRARRFSSSTAALPPCPAQLLPILPPPTASLGIKEEIKESKKQPSFDAPIDSYTDDSKLREALRGFVQMRCAMRKKPTNRALEPLFQELDSLAEDTETKIAILKQSILNGWQGVFPIKDEAKPEKKDDGPKLNWFYG